MVLCISWRRRRAPGTGSRAPSVEQGPVSASGLAGRLGLTPAAVRRHLDAMLADGVVEAREHAHAGPRGRGRPAREFVLTDRGHAAMTTAYDDLAVSALRYVAQTQGHAAVEAFAARPRRRAGAAVHPRRRRGRPRGRGPCGRARGRPVRRRLRCEHPARRRGQRRPRHPAVPGSLPGAARRGRVPRALRGGDEGLLPPARRARAAAGHAGRRRPRLHHPHSHPHHGHHPTRATPCREGHVDDDLGHRAAQPRSRGPRPLRVRLGRLRLRRNQRAARAQRGRRPRHLRPQERAGLDAADAPEGPEAVPPQADADLGQRPDGHRLREHQVLREVHREAGHLLGGPARRHQEHVRPARHPGGGEAAPRRGRRRAVRVRGRLPPDPRGPGGEGRHLPRHRHRAARARGPVPRVLRLRDPARRQQVRLAEHRGVVRRLVHLRAAGREGGHPAAGLLPDQHREHGPVRADADHRRRGLVRALRRGLHRADLQERLAALRGRRDRREEERPGAVHDDPELVEQRLQPRHQAGRPPPRARPWSGSTATSAPRSR